jgi:tRNA(Ile)-lysidine synthetase-like protein
MTKLIFKPKLNKLDKYLVAVSGGPDSMALLSELFSNDYNIVVAHVNYKKRKSADRDQKLVQEFCKKRKIKLFIKTRKEKVEGNFQSWAREYRYNYFKEIYLKEKCSALLTAHHQDDKIETYIMKKQRPAIYNSVSLHDKTIIKEMNVIRPLLEHSKNDLINLCKERNVKFGTDETNQETKYSRNKIRNEVIEKLTVKSREKYLKKIEIDENKLAKSISKSNEEYKLVVDSKTIKLGIFNKLKAINKVMTLYKFLVDNSRVDPRLLSKDRLSSLAKQLNSSKPNLNIKVTENVFIIKSYDKATLSEKVDIHSFSYKIRNTKNSNFKEFKIQSSGDALEGVHVLKQDFPLTIRSYKSGDKIVIKNGHKLVNRLFIDKKIPQILRPSIPVVVNVKGEILLISKLYVKPERKRLQSNLFVVKY